MRKYLRFSGITFLAFIFVLIVFTQSAFGAEPEVFKLKNGHTVVVQEVPSSKLVCVDTWVKTGSINEDDSNSGVAHFLEHLFFKGTQKRKAGEFEKILDGKGAAYNAATSKDFTHYYITTTKNNLPLAMDLQADMLLHPAIPQAELDRERKVVLEEISRSNDSPGTIVFQNLNKMMFKLHPYKRRVLGSEGVIKNISRKEIFDFYNRWYTPSNMVTVVIGDVKKEDVLNLVRKNFVQKKKAWFLKKRHSKEPPISAYASKTVKGDYNTGYIDIGFRGVPSVDSKDAYALDVLATVLGDGRSSRLYAVLKEQKNLVTDIGAGHYSLKDDSIFYISANFNPKSQESEQIKQEIMAQIDKLIESGVTNQELQRAKNIAERSFVYGNESVSNIANMIGYNMVVGGDLSYYTNYIKELKKVSAQDVVDVAKKYLSEDKMAVSVLLPKKIEKAAKTKHIVPVACKIAKNGEVSKKTLKNGMVVISESSNLNDIVAMELLFKGGKFIEPKPGVADVLAKVLLRGTKNRDIKALSQEIENYGIVLAPSLTSDFFQISLKSTKSDFERAYDVLQDILNNSLITKDDVEIAKKEILESIQQAEDSASSVAIDKFREKIYTNAYGRSLRKVKKALPTISREDVLAYYNNYLVSQNLILSYSGNVCPESVERKLDGLIKRKGKKVDSKNFLTKFEPLKKNIKVVTKKKTQTAWVVLGYRTCGIQNEKDYAALKVINSLLGQGMSARLFVDLRERKGLAYEVASTYPNANDNIFFVMYIGTNPKNVDVVQTEFQNELKRLMEEKVPAGELVRAKQRLVGYIALQQETNSQRASARASYEFYGKGHGFLSKYEKLLQSVCADDIIGTAQKYFGEPSVISIVEPIEVK